VSTKKSVPNLISYLHNFFWNFSQFLAIYFELFSSGVIFNSENDDEWVPPDRRRAPRRARLAARRCRVAATCRAARAPASQQPSRPSPVVRAVALPHSRRPSARLAPHAAVPTVRVLTAAVQSRRRPDRRSAAPAASPLARRRRAAPRRRPHACEPSRFLGRLPCAGGAPPLGRRVAPPTCASHACSRRAPRAARADRAGPRTLRRPRPSGPRTRAAPAP
jgi:hypothetical protein